MKQDDDFEIIIQENPELLKAQIAELFSKNEMLSLELENNKLKIFNYEAQKFNNKKVETNEIVQMKKNVTDLQNELESYRLELEMLNQDRAELNQLIGSLTKENQNLKNQLQNKMAVDLTESVRTAEQQNKEIKEENASLQKQVKQLNEKQKTQEMKLKQQLKQITDKEKELDIIFADIEKSKKIDLEKMDADYQKKYQQAAEINAKTQKKLIQSYEKRILELNQQLQNKGNQKGQQSAEKIILAEVKHTIEKHVEDLEGRIQALAFVESKQDMINVCKADFEEIKGSLKKMITFLEKNSL